MANNLKFLIKKRDRLLGRFQAALTASQDLATKRGVQRFRVMEAALPDWKKEIEELVQQINEIELQREEAEPDVEVLNTVDDIMLEIAMASKGIKEDDTAQLQGRKETTTTRRLPEVPLPTFGGEEKNWLAFKERYESLIHNNVDLSDFEKVNFLMGCLRGEPLRLCSNLPPIGKNYDIIWKTLKDQYDDQRMLANRYFDQLLHFKQLSSETVNHLNVFFENFHLTVEALKKLEIPDLVDYMLAHLALSKLPPETQKTFENSHRNSKMIKYEDVITFLKEQRKICFRAESAKTRPDTLKPKPKIQNFFVQQGDKTPCFLCPKLFHRLSECPKFLEKSPRLRYEIVRDKRLCFNCLSFHRIAKCSSTKSCKHCRGRHHTLLHFPQSSQTPAKEEEFKNENPPQTSIVGDENKTLSLIGCSSAEPEQSKSQSDAKMVLLSTAVVLVYNNLGHPKMCRFLLDSGSQANFITEECARFLKLKFRPCCSQIQGIGGLATELKGCVTITLTSRFVPKTTFVLDALIIKRIVEKLPTAPLDRTKFEYLNNISLADPNFHVPSKIDGILGVDMLTRILVGGKISGPPDYPMALATRLGYVIMGSVPKLSDRPKNVHVFCSVIEPPSLEDSLKNFWELETVPSAGQPPNQSASDLDPCEEFFEITHSRNCNGRFVVKIPFQLSPNLLGDSYEIAVQRFLHLEKKFRKNPTFKKHYCEVIDDYLSQGHMILDEQREISNPNYFIPHHGVFKSDSTSTPLRIVFDASCKTSSHYSLNDLLHSGPKLQVDIGSVLLRFRLGKFGFTADLKQMFRQILVSEEDRRFQKIVWRASENDPLKIYCLTTVTFGLKCSPYLAIRVVQQLANDQKERFPEASELVTRDMYVDDLVYSADDSSLSVQVYQQVMEMFRGAGFEVHKWATNCEELNNHITAENRQTNPFDFHKNSLKVLGMSWDPREDVLQFRFRIDRDSTESLACTKRKILSVVARCYDPLGFLSPTLLLAKLIIKDLWQQTLDWDDTPGEDIQTRWKSFREQLHYLSDIKIPRFVQLLPDQSVTLIGFADACKTSYGAVVYLKNSSLGSESQVSLLYAKSKVAPSKTLTIPKLELSSCLLLAKILKFIVESCTDRVKISKIYALTDSTIALSWIKNSSSKLEIFVANRVNAIGNLVSREKWFHISGKNNAADIASRGQGPLELKNNKNWWTGPEWLQLPDSDWPITFPPVKEEAEEAVISLTTLQSTPENPILNFMKRQSNWTRMLGATIYLLKFLRKIPVDGNSLAQNLEAAESFLVKYVQRHYFQEELKLLQNGRVPPKLKHLRPFLQNSIIRVGGRIHAAELDYDARHPILLPKEAPFIHILIDHIHSKNFHTGANLTLALLRSKYWVLSARNLVRSRINTCNFCFRFRPKGHPPLMGDLPPCRLHMAKAFFKTGVDYAGPIHIIPYRKRGVKSVKAYICLFVCMVTKSLHLELVTDLSTQNFLQAFKRFISRRGSVREIFSDNGTNFIGAKAELDTLYKLLHSVEHNQIIDQYLAGEGVKWHLIPPGAPHMGGLWESNVKMVKTHLFKGIKNQLLTYEELNTILIQIEALLNSRPLCVLSSDPSDPTALTPSHFLTLGPLSDLPASDVTEIPMNRLSRYQLLDQIIQNFWRRWHVEYLHSLQPRVKWCEETPPIKVGDIVLLEIPNNPPLKWPLGIVERLYPGADGITRVVDVKIKDTSYRRPLTKLYKLPLQ